jgi:membrane protein implicated in regulation of membrane protease activity
MKKVLMIILAAAVIFILLDLILGLIAFAFQIAIIVIAVCAAIYFVNEFVNKDKKGGD